jgi:hypothetical protein
LNVWFKFTPNHICDIAFRPLINVFAEGFNRCIRGSKDPPPPEDPSLGFFSILSPSTVKKYFASAFVAKVAG